MDIPYNHLFLISILKSYILAIFKLVQRNKVFCLILILDIA